MKRSTFVGGDDLIMMPNLSFAQTASAFKAGGLVLLDGGAEKLFTYQGRIIHTAASNGLLIDAGHLPDAIVRSIGRRGAELAYARAFDHPFGDRPYLITHTWEGDDATILPKEVTEEQKEWWRNKGATRNAYLIEPTSDEECFGAIVTEYLFVQVKAQGIGLVPMVRITLRHTDPDRMQVTVQGDPQLLIASSASSALNPLMCVLTLMNTRGVPYQTRAEPVLRNARLAKHHRPTMPGYIRLETADYITAITHKPKPGATAAGEKGKRRSPIPHLRRGHVRVKESGYAIWIHDSLINCKSEGDLSFAERHRTAYRVRV